MDYRERRKKIIDRLISAILASKRYDSRIKWYKTENIRKRGFPTYETITDWLNERGKEGNEDCMRLYKAFETAETPQSIAQITSRKLMRQYMPLASKLLAELDRQAREEPYDGPKTTKQWHERTKIKERFGISLNTLRQWVRDDEKAAPWAKLLRPRFEKLGFFSAEAKRSSTEILCKEKFEKKKTLVVEAVVAAAELLKNQGIAFPPKISGWHNLADFKGMKIGMDSMCDVFGDIMKYQDKNKEHLQRLIDAGVIGKEVREHYVQKQVLRGILARGYDGIRTLLAFHRRNKVELLEAGISYWRLYTMAHSLEFRGKFEKLGFRLGRRGASTAVGFADMRLLREAHLLALARQDKVTSPVAAWHKANYNVKINGHSMRSLKLTYHAMRHFVMPHGAFSMPDLRLLLIRNGTLRERTMPSDGSAKQNHPALRTRVYKSLERLLNEYGGAKSPREFCLCFGKGIPPEVGGVKGLQELLFKYPGNEKFDSAIRRLFESHGFDISHEQSRHAFELETLQVLKEGKWQMPGEINTLATFWNYLRNGTPIAEAFVGRYRINYNDFKLLAEDQKGILREPLMRIGLLDRNGKAFLPDYRPDTKPVAPDFKRQTGTAMIHKGGRVPLLK